MSLFKMSKEYKVGLVVIIAGVILYTGFQFLKGKDFMSSTNTYYAKYANVQGLTVSNPVLYKGYAVGRVEAITYDLEISDSIEVMFEINDDIIIPQGSQALIGSSLLGEVFVILHFGKSDQIVEEDGFLIGGKDEAILDAVGEVVSPVAARLDTLLSNFNAGFNRQTMDSLAKAVQNLATITEGFKSASTNLSAASQSVNGIVGKISKAMNSVNEIMGELKPMIANFNEISDSLKAANISGMIASLDTSMQQLSGVMTKINNGEGSLGKLVTDKALYENLNATIKNIDFLAADFQANPHRYVNVNIIGKKPEEITLINRVKPSKLKNGATHLEVELKRNIPDDLVVNFYDMTEKTITPITYNRVGGSSTKIEFDIPSGTKPGDHAVRVSWNKDKDTDYASILVK